VVVVSLFGHLDGVEHTVGDPGVGGALALAAPRLHFGSLTRGQQAAKFSGAVRGFLQAKAQRFSANVGDACGCRFPLEGVVEAILPMQRLRVKTLDLVVSTAATLCVVTLLGALSWSPDTTRVSLFFVVLVFLCFSFFIFDLICKRFSSPSCIIGPLIAIVQLYSGVKASFARRRWRLKTSSVLAAATRYHNLYYSYFSGQNDVLQNMEMLVIDDSVFFRAPVE
jgi:hypothetical protein